MPSYKYTDQDNRPPAVKPGKYKYTVTDCGFGLTRNGDDKMELSIEIEGGARCYETLTFTQNAMWRIDTFVKSSNLLVDGKPPAKGQPIEFTQELVVGLRGWAEFILEEYPVGSGKTRNKVGTWLTNAEKLKRADIAPPPKEDAEPDWDGQ